MELPALGPDIGAMRKSMTAEFSECGQECRQLPFLVTMSGLKMCVCQLCAWPWSRKADLRWQVLSLKCSHPSIGIWQHHKSPVLLLNIPLLVQERL